MQINASLMNVSLRVCVDQAAQGRVAGRVYSQHLSEPLPFDDIAQLPRMEQILDLQRFPQAFQRRRTFTPAPETQPEPPSGQPMTREQVQSAQGQVCTFWLTVLTRQNTSWQGAVTWSEQEPPEPFASELELLRLVDRRLFPGK